MKCEQPGYCATSFSDVDLHKIAKFAKRFALPAPDQHFSGLKKYLPGELPIDLEFAIEEFLFPPDKYTSAINRRTEIQISRKYLMRSTVFVYFVSGKIFGTWRIIAKDAGCNEIPIEAARIVKITDSAFEPFLKVGELFSANSLPHVLPSCEIGGLRILGFDSGITLDTRQRLNMFLSIKNTCENEGKIKGYATGFLTCMGTPVLQRLYEDKFGFHEFAEVSYGGDQVWKALIRHE